MIENIKEYWAFFTTVFVGITTGLTWWFNFKKKAAEDDEKSDRINLEKLEKFKIKIIELMESKVSDLERIHELHFTLELMKKECPQCYKRVLIAIKNINGEERPDQRNDS